MKKLRFFYMPQLFKLYILFTLGFHGLIASAQLVETEGDIRISDGTPTLELWDNNPSEDRLEFEIRENNNNIRLHALHGNLEFYGNNDLQVELFEDSTVIYSQMDVQGDLRIGEGFASGILKPSSFGLQMVGQFHPEEDNNPVLGLLGNSGRRWHQVWAANGVIQTSDKRLKKNINPLNGAISKIKQLNPVSYYWKNGETNKQLGLLAQEVYKIIPEAVVTHEEVYDQNGKVVTKEVENLGMNYSTLIPVLIKAIQEQQEQIEALQAKVNVD